MNQVKNHTIIHLKHKVIINWAQILILQKPKPQKPKQIKSNLLFSKLIQPGKIYLEVKNNLSANNIFPSLCHTFQVYSNATPLGCETRILGRYNISALCHNFKLYKNYPGPWPDFIPAHVAAFLTPTCRCNVCGGLEHLP